MIDKKLEENKIQIMKIDPRLGVDCIYTFLSPLGVDCIYTSLSNGAILQKEDELWGWDS
ncbi:hypothetical protein [Cyclobacterium qasimii]|uniref:Uncharacterized protein n=1 Tax=Cyclobacterium qasimii TaxID=1350429 RepID=A0A512C9U5_9BACT|nr:hypothetical protein [Cyclobacterium qasimii]GEO20887.1 hypothetical protein CQA01_14210 [Cyclobacterium qasimii]